MAPIVARRSGEQRLIKISSPQHDSFARCAQRQSFGNVSRLRRGPCEFGVSLRADKSHYQRAQLRIDERLGQKMPSFIEHEHSFGEPGHQQHFELRPLASHLSGQVYAGHPLHLKVRQQKVYFVLVILRLLKGFLSTAGAENLVVAVNQQRTDGIQDVSVVVNHKNRLLIVFRYGYFLHWDNFRFTYSHARREPFALPDVKPQVSRNARLHSRRGNSDQISLDGILDYLNAIMQIQLAHHVGLMVVDSLYAKDEARGDFLQSETVSQQFKHFTLAAAQAFIVGGSALCAPDMLAHHFLQGP